MSSETNPRLCLIDVLRFAATRVPGNSALLAPGRPNLSYAELLEHVEHTAGLLNGFGLTRTSRVLLVIPNGPEQAGAILATASVCTAVPLNPDIAADDFKLLLQRSKAEAVLVLRGTTTPAREIAHECGIRVIELISSPEMPAGYFELEGAAYTAPTFSEPEDIALLISTSGTTGLPKFVPNRHQLLFKEYFPEHVWQFSAATADDPKSDVRILNMLPLFHTFGLSGLTSALAYGTGFIATRGFNVEDFYTFLDTYRPTSFPATPAMLNAIVGAASSYKDVLARSSLVYISTTSAPLSVEVTAEIRRIFNAMLLITYGMTEVGAITSMNSFMDRYFRPGSVGQPTTDVAIIDEDNNVLSPGKIGEVVVRNAELFRGYEGDPHANDEVMKAGWFHTGDAGYLDEDNYLFLTGRLKETINRGGEKISPYEVEQALTRHPAVKEAAVFGVPHLVLGEDLAGVVVVSDPALTSKTLRKFAAERLAPQKVPGTILIVDQIPKTPTGKIRRAALPQLLGLTSSDGERTEGRGLLAPAVVVPRNEVEQDLLLLWTRILDLPEISIYDDFFEALGGTSLQAAQMVIEVDKKFDITLPVASLFEAPTIAEMAELLSHLNENSLPYSSAIPLQPLGQKPPLFCVPGLYGQVIGFRPLTVHLGVDQPVYGLQTPGIDGKTKPFTRIEALAEYLVQKLQAVQPHGPYLLCGLSFGGIVALEMAQILDKQGESVPVLAVLDALLGDNGSFPILKTRFLYDRIKVHGSRLTALNMGEQAHYISGRVEMLWGAKKRSISRELLPGVQAITAANTEAMKYYRPKPYRQPIIYFSTRQGRASEQSWAYEARWKQLAFGGFEICDSPGRHGTMIDEPNVQVLAEKLKSYIDHALVSK